MRSKVVTNLDTSDPLEAEILDMLAGMKSSHRRQERLRSLLKAGYNLLHKNLGKEQAIAQAFDRLDHSDFSMILSLLAQNNQFLAPGSDVVQPLVPPSAAPQVMRQEAMPSVAPPGVVSQDSVGPDVELAVNEPVVAHKEVSAKVVEPVRGKYEEMTTSLDDFLDVDPSLMDMERGKADEDEFVDPLKRLFSVGKK
ncbi:hypothetical protein RYA05_05480 [Pseudomonas syringae pv. actinidiae]|nr:hypothetical protein [Pseudomonas syringae pv. actinidiae]